METGEYHFGQQIQQDQYDRMKTMPAVVAAISKPEGWTTAVLNHKQGLMTDKRVRQAFQAALDMEPIMAAGFGNKAFYRLDPGLSFAEQPQWHSRVAGELYNQKNPAKAKKLLADAGYAGQPVRWITTKEYQWMYKNALVAKQQLEAAGFKVDLQVVDWATLVQRRNKPEVWDVFSTGITFNPEPAFSTGDQLRLAGLVVSRGQGAVDGGARPRERPPEAAGHVGEGADPLLRGRRPCEVRRLLRSHRGPQGSAGISRDQRDEPVERVAEVIRA